MILSKVTRLKTRQGHLEARIFESLVIPKGPLLLGGSIAFLPSRAGPLARRSLVPGDKVFLSDSVIHVAARKHGPHLGGGSEQGRECGRWRGPQTSWPVPTYCGRVNGTGARSRQRGRPGAHSKAMAGPGLEPASFFFNFTLLVLGF